MKIRLFLILLFIAMSYTVTLAQNDTIMDNSYYFDDGGISASKNVLKINVLSIINGDLPVYYERVFGESFSIEIGAGVLLPYYIPELPQLFMYDSEIDSPDIGYSIWVHPKYYLQGKAPELSYIGFQYRRRNYNQDSQSIVFSDLTYNYGLQFFLSKRFVLDYNIGLGVRFKTEKSNIIKREIDGLAFPIGIKLGIIL